MKRKILILSCVLALVACKNKDESTPKLEKEITVEYPQTKKGTVVDTYFGQEVEDPYRWLEDDRSAETAQWVKQQNEVTFTKSFTSCSNTLFAVSKPTFLNSAIIQSSISFENSVSSTSSSVAPAR